MWQTFYWNECIQLPKIHGCLSIVRAFELVRLHASPHIQIILDFAPSIPCFSETPHTLHVLSSTEHILLVHGLENQYFLVLNGLQSVAIIAVHSTLDSFPVETKQPKQDSHCLLCDRYTRPKSKLYLVNNYQEIPYIDDESIYPIRILVASLTKICNSSMFQILNFSIWAKLINRDLHLLSARTPLANTFYKYVKHSNSWAH